MEDPQDLRERVIGALGAVLAVALVIGAVAGVAAYGAVRASGLGGGDVAAASTSPRSAPSSSRPSETATPSASPTPSPSASPTPSPVHHSTPKPKKKARHHHARPRLTLAARQRHVSPMGRIDLHGRYPGHGGTRLLVQRLQGGRWSRFPVSVTVRGGTFHTWVASGHRGPNRFRVVDRAGGRASAPVTVRVG